MRALIFAAALVCEFAAPAFAQDTHVVPDRPQIQAQPPAIVREPTPPPHTEAGPPNGQLADYCVVGESIEGTSADSFWHYFWLADPAGHGQTVQIWIEDEGLRIRVPPPEGRGRSSSTIESKWNTQIETLRAAAVAGSPVGIIYQNRYVAYINVTWTHTCLQSR